MSNPMERTIAKSAHGINEANRLAGQPPAYELPERDYEVSITTVFAASSPEAAYEQMVEYLQQCDFESFTVREASE